MSLAMASNIEYRRLRAPRGQGETLVEPALAAASDLVAANRRQMSTVQQEIGGQSFASLRQDARANLLQAAGDYSRQYRNVSESEHDPARPIVLTGHQPELFHPGVWFKNVVLSQLGQQLGAATVNLVIDNDTLTTPTIRVPVGSLASPRVESVAFDKPFDVVPYEARDVIDRDRFASFASRVREAVGDMLPRETILDSLWPAAVERVSDGMKLGQAIAAARHAYEEQWGLQTLEFPLSHVCQGEPFRRFLLHLAANIEPFRAIYNEALGEYRQVHKLRSRSHPAPDLARDGDFVEAPFWIWSTDSPRRGGLYLRRSGSQLELTDRDQLSLKMELPSGDTFDAAVCQLAEWEADGVCLRPRALMTTMFARLFLGDLFIHGIGGAKYDQLTDAIIARFFGLEPPSYMTATATVYPPFDLPEVAASDLTRLRRQRRELEYHAEKHIDFERYATARDLAAEKAVAIGATPEVMRSEARHAAIASANRAMQPFVQSQYEAIARELEQSEQDLRRRKLLRSREFSFCLFQDRFLRELLFNG